MKTRAYLLAALTCAVLALPAGAETVYKISLVDGMEILSAMAPVPSGTMLLVKNLSDGSLTAVPAELVSNVAKVRTATAFATKTVNSFAADAVQKTDKALVPASRLVTVTDSGTGAKPVVVLPAGQRVAGSLTTLKMAGVLTSAGVPATFAAGKSKSVTLTSSLGAAQAQGSLAGSIATARAFGNGATRKLVMALQPGQQVFLGHTGGTSAATRIDTAVVSLRAGTSAGSALSVDPFRASIQDQIFAGDLPRLTPRSGLTAGTVTPTAGELVIGPNGFPDLTAARTGIQPVSPNGFPTTATAISPTGLTRAAGSLTTALPVTITPATAAAVGAINVPATFGTAASSAAPAAASPR